MRISYCSDLHLEFGDLELDNANNADVLVLGGDICIAEELYNVDTKRSIRYMEFFERVNDMFPLSLYLMGNHEHYHGDFSQSANIIREKLAQFENIRFLDKEWITVEDGDNLPVVFVGGTLWTDFGRDNPEAMMTARYMMNDFKCIRYSEKQRRFTPEDAYADHQAMLDAVEFVADRFPRVVVCGHHAPTKRSTKPEYQDDVMLNHAYSSDLEDFILTHPSIELWTHGHTHSNFEHMIGNTRVVCNPRGYIGYEMQAEEFKLRTVTI